MDLAHSERGLFSPQVEDSAAGDEHKTSAVVVVEQLPPPPKAFNVPIVDLRKYQGDDKENAFR